MTTESTCFRIIRFGYDAALAIEHTIGGYGLQFLRKHKVQVGREVALVAGKLGPVADTRGRRRIGICRLLQSQNDIISLTRQSRAKANLLFQKPRSICYWKFLEFYAFHRNGSLKESLEKSFDWTFKPWSLAKKNFEIPIMKSSSNLIWNIWKCQIVMTEKIW